MKLSKLLLMLTILAGQITMGEKTYSQDPGPVFGTIPKESKTTQNEKQQKKPQSVSKEELFKKIDKDNNSIVSKEEFMSTRSAKKSPTKASLSFARMDRNGDGQLSLEEYKNPPQKQTQR
jgi:hypothetical protein